jgi:hypothetical protein
LNNTISKHLSLVFAAFIFSIVYFLAINNGLNFTADSRHYINVAEQIYQNGFISIWKNEELVYWPPLYPIILSFLLKPDNLIFLKVFNYLISLLTMFLWNRIASIFLHDQKQHFLFIILFALSTNILMISVFIWSELLFLCLFSWTILLIEKYIRTGTPFWILLSIVPSFLMLIQRNAGIFLISALYISILFLKARPKGQIKIMFLSYLFSISGFLIWNVKNIIIENRPYMITELVPYFTPVKNFSLVVNEIGAIFYPSLVFYPFSVLPVNTGQPAPNWSAVYQPVNGGQFSRSKPTRSQSRIVYGKQDYLR